MVSNQESEKDDNGSGDDKEDEKPNEKQKDMDKPKINEDRKTPQKSM